MTGATKQTRTGAPPPRPPRAAPGLRTPDPNGFEPAPVHDAAPVARQGEAFQQGGQTIDREAFDYHRAMMRRESRAKRSSRLRPAMFAALALVLAVLGVGLAGVMGLPGFTGLAGFMTDLPGRSKRGIATSPVPEVPATAPVASRPTAPPLVAVAAKEPLIAPDAPQPSPPRIVGEEQAKQEPSGTPSTPAPIPPKT